MPELPARAAAAAPDNKKDRTAECHPARNSPQLFAAYRTQRRIRTSLVHALAWPVG